MLAIGGLREKSTAAYTMGIRTLLIPKENMRDIAELDEVVRNEVEFIPCETLDDVLKNALVYPSEKISTAENDKKKKKANPSRQYFPHRTRREFTGATDRIKNETES